MLSHQAFIIDVPTIFAWDTDDSTEETRSGKRTAHIILQKKLDLAKGQLT